MSDCIKMRVRHSEVDPKCTDDSWHSYLYVERECVEYFFDNNIWEDFHPQTGDKTFETWLDEYTDDDTEGLLTFCEDRDSVIRIYTPDSRIEYLDEFCPKCNLNFSYREGNCKCHRCGYAFTAGSFVDDVEKMIDFFLMDKKDFLEFYSYLTEEDYKATCEDVIKKSDYWNTDWTKNNPDMGGKELRDICFGIMITEWLEKRG